MRQYYYLIASLPMLEFGMKMPFPYARFLSSCREQVSGHDMELIERSSISPPEDTKDTSPTLREWKRFDTALRNELVKVRADKYSKDPHRYIRGEGYIDHNITTFVQWAVNQDSPLESELALDRMKWEKIEDLRLAHYFDIDYLITYALQLQILERWERINAGDGMTTLEILLEKEIA